MNAGAGAPVAFGLAAPDAWPWALAVLVVAVGCGWLQRAGSRRAAALVGRRLDHVAGAPVHRRLRAACAAVGVGAAALALLQPVRPGRDTPFAPDLVICLDVSRSMGAGDEPPSRFGAARRELDDLLAAAVGARCALVAYAGEARLVAPLTADLQAIGWLAEELAPGAVVRDGSDPGAAVGLAVAMAARAGASAAIVLLTDGEDFVGAGAAAAAAARAAGHRVHALGFGRAAGAKIVVGDRGDAFLRTAEGDDVITRLEVNNLRAIAAAGGGSFARADQPGALRDLYRRELLPRAIAAGLATGRGVPVARWLLLAAFVAWMLRWWLRERR